MIDNHNAFDEFFSASKKTIPPSNNGSIEEFFGKTTSIPEQTKPVIVADDTDALDFFGSGTSQRMREQRDKIEQIYAPYKAVLEDYVHNVEAGKWQFFDNDPNQGYKFHLNVKPENVRQVAATLKLGEYQHKYLSGGEVEDGKIFTVYTGSKQQTEQIVREVVDSEIAFLLEKPLVDGTGEVPYAPNIVGRFVGNRERYLTKVPRLGITVLRTADKDSVQASFAKTNAALLADYGDYYGGGISYYEPKQ